MPPLEVADDRPTVVFHGTLPHRADAALEHGLHPGRGSGGLVYFSEHLDIAAWWGSRCGTRPVCVLAVDVQGLAVERHWSGIGSWTVAGTVSAKRLRRLETDPDAWERGRDLIDAAYGVDDEDAAEPAPEPTPSPRAPAPTTAAPSKTRRASRAPGALWANWSSEEVVSGDVVFWRGDQARLWCRPVSSDAKGPDARPIEMDDIAHWDKHEPGLLPVLAKQLRADLPRPYRRAQARARQEEREAAAGVPPFLYHGMAARWAHHVQTGGLPCPRILYESADVAAWFGSQFPGMSGPAVFEIDTRGLLAEPAGPERCNASVPAWRITGRRDGVKRINPKRLHRLFPDPDAGRRGAVALGLPLPTPIPWEAPENKPSKSFWGIVEALRG